MPGQPKKRFHQIQALLERVQQLELDIYEVAPERAHWVHSEPLAECDNVGKAGGSVVESVSELHFRLGKLIQAIECRTQNGRTIAAPPYHPKADPLS